VQGWHFAGSLALPVEREIARSQTYVVPNPADHATRGSSLSWAARVYVSIVIAAGGSTLVAFFPRTYPRPALLAALIIFSCVTSLWKVNLPISTSSGSTLSVSHAANLMALLLLGLPPAIVVAVAGVLAQCTYKVKKSYPLYRTLFSVAAAVLTMATTSVAYHQLGGSLGPVDMAELAKPIIGAIAVYFVVNTSLIAGAIALTSRRSFVNVWRGDFLWSGVSFMVAGSAGAMAAAVVARGDHWKAILLIAPIYLTYRTYEVFVGRLADQTRHMAEMRLLHQGTVEALAHAQQAEHAEQVARAAAERANRLKDQFLAVVSHELRTPLTAILGWAGMLRRGQLDEGRRDRAFQSIYDSARRQAQLIDDLLDVSRIMSGTLRLERTAIDLKMVVDDAIRAVQPAADAKNVHLTIEADSWLGFIQGDGARLEQVVLNLLSNAVKFTPGGGRVQVRLKRVQDFVEIEIRDTGQGISAEFLSHIFEPFRQADGSTTRAHGGLGLGLSIVKHLVEAHDGVVEVHSAGAGLGATFIARFPIDPACADQTSQPVDHATAVSVDAPALDNVSVLVVDDDAETRLVVMEHLRRCNGVVFTAASAADAYDVLQREHIDVLLADIGMPGEDGYTLIRRVRAGVIPASASVPAAAITAFAREEDRHLALHAGFQMHLVKPLDPDCLLAAVTSLARLRGAPIAGKPSVRPRES
jgi:signal transduction histidine kinase/ActR/RegA family two-component response regulator